MKKTFLQNLFEISSDVLILLVSLFQIPTCYMFKDKRTVPVIYKWILIIHALSFCLIPLSLCVLPFISLETAPFEFFLGAGKIVILSCFTFLFLLYLYMLTIYFVVRFKIIPEKNKDFRKRLSPVKLIMREEFFDLFAIIDRIRGYKE